MKAEFKDYLRDLRVSQTVSTYIDSKYVQLKALSGVEEFDDIFISEGMSNNGNREYINLYFFKGKIMTRADFKNGELSALVLDKNIRNYVIDRCNFDLTNVTIETKMNLSVKRYHAEAFIILSASGLNCTHLLRIMKLYLLPNLN
jgi:hypothetical protein